MHGKGTQTMMVPLALNIFLTSTRYQPLWVSMWLGYQSKDPGQWDWSPMTQTDQWKGSTLGACESYLAWTASEHKTDCTGHPQEQVTRLSSSCLEIMPRIKTRRLLQSCLMLMMTISQQPRTGLLYMAPTNIMAKVFDIIVVCHPKVCASFMLTFPVICWSSTLEQRLPSKLKKKLEKGKRKAVHDLDVGVITTTKCQDMSHSLTTILSLFIDFLCLSSAIWQCRTTYMTSIT